MSSNKSELIYKLKGIAILSVVCAHCGNRVSYTSLDLFLNDVRNNIATIGVPLFFVISGYLMKNGTPYLEFWKHKWNTTIVPWLFWGIIVWIYEVIRKGLGYADLLEWLWGIGTYLWFMRTIALFWAILYFLRNRKQKFFVFFLSVIVRVCLYDIFNIKIDNVVLTDFILNLPFFSFGMWMKEAEISKNMKQDSVIIKILAGFFIIVALLKNQHNITYASPLFLIYIVGCAIIIITLEKKIHNSFINNKLVIWGKYSYFIYLIHMPLAGIVSNLFSRNSALLYLVFLQPVLVLLATEYIIKILERICNRYQSFSFVLGRNRTKID